MVRPSLAIYPGNLEHPRRCVACPCTGRRKSAKSGHQKVSVRSSECRWHQSTNGQASVKYFVPDIRCAEELGTQIGLQDKFGGVPWGLRSSMWPVCKECGKPQSLLAQLAHDDDRLDLGRDGRVLFVFQCAHDPGMCATWEGNSGANACFVCEAEDLTEGRTDPPSVRNPEDNEVRVIGWRPRLDSVSAELAPSFFDEARFFELPAAVLESITFSTRTGSVPRWLQSPAEAPNRAEGWRFIAQLDSSYSFLQAPIVAADWISTDDERFEGRTHIAGGPNFGDGGIAYIFLRDAHGVPECMVFWQCL